MTTASTSSDPSLLVLAGPRHVLSTSGPTTSSEAGPSSSNTSTTKRFLLLPHPRTGLPTYFLPACSTNQSDNRYASIAECDEIYELQAVKNEKNTRSWFLNGSEDPSGGADGTGKGWVMQDGTLHVLFPIDPIFLMLSILQHASDDKYLSQEDLFEEAASSCYQSRVQSDFATLASRAAKSNGSGPNSTSSSVSNILGSESDEQPTWSDIVTFSHTRSAHLALEQISDIQSTQDERFFRPSIEKVRMIIRAKVARLMTAEQFEAFPGTLGKALSKQTEWNAKEDELSEKRVEIAAEIVRGWIPAGSKWEKVLDEVKVALMSHE